jgi:hypothetical protein
LFEHDLFGKPVPTFPDHALERIAVTADSVSGRSARRGGLFCAEDIAATGTEFQARHKAADSAGPLTGPPIGLFWQWNLKAAQPASKPAKIVV